VDISNSEIRISNFSFVIFATFVENDWVFFFRCNSATLGTIMMKIMGKFAKLSSLTFIVV
jgi:hypothetical protein